MSARFRLRSDKVIFLDVDGVLNSLPFVRSVKGRESLLSHLDPRAVRVFADLVHATGAEVVLSSSWRIIVSLQQMAAWLRERGFTGRLIGATPHDVPAPAGRFSCPRGLEIQQWLDVHGTAVTSFVILDDESDMAHLEHRLVKTDMNVGLTAEDSARAIEVLQRPVRPPGLAVRYAATKLLTPRCPHVTVPPMNSDGGAAGETQSVYVSVDVETDGPIPGPHSMLSLGAAAFRHDGREIGTFTANLHTLMGASMSPVTRAFWAQHQDAYEATRVDALDPGVVMGAFHTWLKELPATPVFVGYPVAFDWLFVHWYLIRFVGENPFGYSGIDIESFAAPLLQMDYRDVVRSDAIEKRWPSRRPHTHVALADAIEQGEMFMQMLKESRR